MRRSGTERTPPSPDRRASPAARDAARGSVAGRGTPQRRIQRDRQSGEFQLRPRSRRLPQRERQRATARSQVRAGPRAAGAVLSAAVSTTSSTAGDAFDDRTITTVTAWQASLDDRFTPELAVAARAQATAAIAPCRRPASATFPFETHQHQYAWQNDFTLPAGRADAGARAARGARRHRCRVRRARTRTPTPSTGVYRFDANGHALQTQRAARRFEPVRRPDDRRARVGLSVPSGLARDGKRGNRVQGRRRSTTSTSRISRIPTCGRRHRATSRSASTRPGQAARRALACACRRVSQPRARPDRVPVRREFQLCARTTSPTRRSRASRSTGRRGWRDTIGQRDRVDLQSPNDCGFGRLLPRRARRHGVVVVVAAVSAARVFIAEFVALVGALRRRGEPAPARRLFGSSTSRSNGRSIARTTVFVRGDNVLDRDYELAADFAHRRRARVRGRPLANMKWRTQVSRAFVARGFGDARLAAFDGCWRLHALVATAGRAGIRSSTTRARPSRWPRPRGGSLRSRRTPPSSCSRQGRGRRSSASSRAPTIRRAAKALPVIGDADRRSISSASSMLAPDLIVTWPWTTPAQVAWLRASRDRGVSKPTRARIGRHRRRHRAHRRR